MTGNEKWIHYDNFKHRKSWANPSHASTSVAKLNIYGSKLLRCICLDQLGVVYYEQLKLTKTITRDPYWLQLMHLSWVLKKKWLLYEQRHDKVILQHDNARPHVEKSVKTYSETLRWEVLPPSAVFTRHCPIWLSLVLIDGTWPSWAALSFLWRCQKWVNTWLASKDVSFFWCGIQKLLKR